MNSKRLFLILFGLSTCPRLNAQFPQCATLADGCDAGTANQNAFYAAAYRFQDGVLYGGTDPVVFSSALQGSTLGMVTYACSDGSIPPRMEGSAIRSSILNILACENLCGGVASPSNTKCGFGVLIVNNGANMPCFSKAVNVAPKGTTTTTTTSLTTTTSSTTTSKMMTTTATTPVNATPTINPGSDPWQFVGCVDDNAATRVLANSQTSPDMTVEKCLELAFSYQYAALQGGDTCYWDDDIVASSTIDAASCVQKCAGEAGEACGGSLKNLLYKDTSYEVISIEDMIVQLKILNSNQKQMLSLLQLWEKYLSLAEADAEVSAKRWQISLLWLSRLVPAWSELRLAATVLNNIGRLVRRRSRVWYRKATVALQRVVPQRPNVVNEYEMQVFGQVQSYAQEAETIADQILGHAAEEAVALAQEGELVLVTAAGLVIGISNFFATLLWHENLQGDFEPTPPDDGNPPPEASPRTPCPCGRDSEGCAIDDDDDDSMFLKREAQKFENMKSKRATGGLYWLTNCPNIGYQANKYPSSGEFVAFLRSINQQPLLTDSRWFSAPATDTPQTTKCFWRLDQFTTAQLKDHLNAGAGFSDYSTEHVFENAFLKYFFDRMVEDECVPCEDATPVAPPGQIPIPTPGLRELFFRPNNLANSNFSTWSVVDYLVEALSWYDVNLVNDNPDGYKEFFILEQRINNNKRAILTRNVPLQTVGATLEDFVQQMARMELVMSYMNKSGVALVFQAVTSRLVDIFARFDSEHNFGWLYPPIRSTKCMANWGAAQLGHGWAEMLLEWVNRLLIDAEQKVSNWQVITTAVFDTQIDIHYPPGIDPINNQDWKNFLNRATTPDPVYGCLAVDRFQFDRMLYRMFRF
ncbi:hypothetical protein TWF694_011597 [Orbilia ellipsospora]|uniref:WSC domain-containing protein n=1 Tax=Orbilia ellipsospora TaxID=2528407 RepID=A0AAV9X5N4_9PEZI